MKEEKYFGTVSLKGFMHNLNPCKNCNKEYDKLTQDEETHVYE